MTWFIIFLVVVFLGLILFVFIRKKKPEMTKESLSDKIEMPEDLLEKLKDLNMKLRIEFGIERAVLEKSEQIIDKLWYLLPELSKNHSATELEWVVRKIAKEYLPDLVNKFLKLTPEFRQSNNAATVTALESLLSELVSIEKMVGEHDALKLKGQALYLKERFFK